MATNRDLTPAHGRGLRASLWAWIPAAAALALAIWLLVRYA
jgi:lipopolysaccharide export LptBFGC system permease protein LptF